MPALVSYAVAASLAVAVAGQQLGNAQEYHIPMPVQSCRKYGGCHVEQAEVVMDMQWRWMHNKDGYRNCLPGEFWDTAFCPDPATCSRNCAMEGVDQNAYTQNYGAHQLQNGIKLDWPKGPRVYMLDGPDKYKMFRLLNKEFTFDVDLSTLPCGLNAALYFVEMDEFGDRSGSNPGGAKYGTGYCDAQCPHMRFIRGEANLIGWEKLLQRENPDGQIIAGGHEGKYGYCCAELDVLEANRDAGVFTSHPCNREKQTICEGKDQCGDKGEGKLGICDKDGCGFSDYRMGSPQFWGAGPNFAVDTSKPMTVVTQFLTHDGTDHGDLVEVRRFYVQNNQVVQNSQTTLLPNGGDSLTDAMCNEQSHVFKQKTNGHRDLGGLKAMGEAMRRGMVLSMSIWDSDFDRMLWLDGEKSRFDDDMSQPGIKRGPCPFHYGDREDNLRHAEQHGPMSVTFTNIRYGDLGSTIPLV
ncbi:CBH1 [Symbiodinium sp. CCMP2592]|nr:CBH1 [Symbiodinium sp. CCMP2592]